MDLRQRKTFYHWLLVTRFITGAPGNPKLPCNVLHAGDRGQRENFSIFKQLGKQVLWEETRVLRICIRKCKYKFCILNKTKWNIHMDYKSFM